MQEVKILSWWVVITDKNEYKLSSNEMAMLIDAERNGARFVLFDTFMLNTAFVKEAYRKIEKKDMHYSIISEQDKKYLIDSEEILKITN